MYQLQEAQLFDDEKQEKAADQAGGEKVLSLLPFTPVAQRGEVGNTGQ